MNASDPTPCRVFPPQTCAFCPRTCVVIGDGGHQVRAGRGLQPVPVLLQRLPALLVVRDVSQHVQTLLESSHLVGHLLQAAALQNLGTVSNGGLHEGTGQPARYGYRLPLYYTWGRQVTGSNGNRLPLSRTWERWIIKLQGLRVTRSQSNRVTELQDVRDKVCRLPPFKTCEREEPRCHGPTQQPMWVCPSTATYQCV